MHFITFLSATLAMATTAFAGTYGQTAAVNSGTDFCFFLPPNYGGNIAANEDRAVAFCTKPISTAPGAQIFPNGFIRSAHYVKNSSKGYVQVTGRIDRTKYGLSASDGGGQYDTRAPVGASCAGYSSFVNLIEPDQNIYCMRCCKSSSDCNVSHSTYGCEKIVAGDYS